MYFAILIDSKPIIMENLLQLCIGDVIRQPIREIWEKSDVLKWWRENNRRSRKKGCANILSKLIMFLPV